MNGKNPCIRGTTKESQYSRSPLIWLMDGNLALGLSQCVHLLSSLFSGCRAFLGRERVVELPWLMGLRVASVPPVHQTPMTRTGTA